MHCCTDQPDKRIKMTDSSRRWLRWIAAGLVLVGLGQTRAQQGPMLDAGPPRTHIDPSELDPKVRAAAATLDKLDTGAVASPEEWAVICEACGLNPAVHGIAVRVKPFPSETLVALLTHVSFGVRNGALEILESKSRDDFGFDPWDPSSDTSKAALIRWQTWLKPGSAKPDADKSANEAPLDDAKLRGYLVDLAGTDVSKHERAFEALSHQAMRSVAAMEQYLHDTPQLTEGVRAKLKEAQYRLVIHETLPVDAARLARQLAFGTRDLKLDALRQMPRMRDKAVPIIAEFLADPDGLLREAAMDALILAGEESVYDLVEQRLKTETDENVIHAVLRRVSPKTERGAKLLTSFVTAPNEDLAVAALNALSDAGSNDAASKVKECLADKRWRVRVAALEYAGKIRDTADGEEILKAFQDGDEFVRYAAMKAAADAHLSEAIQLITEMALKDNSMVGPAVEAIVRMGHPLPEKLEDSLPSKPGDVLLVVLRAFGQHAGHDGEQINFALLDPGNRGGRPQDVDQHAAALQAMRIVRKLAMHRDPDVRAAALHVLGNHLTEASDKKLVYDALKTVPSDEARANILGGIRPGGFDFRETTTPEPVDDNQSIVTVAADDVFARVLSEPAPRNPNQDAVYEAFGVKLEKPTAPTLTVVAAAPGDRVWAPMDKEFSELLAAGMDSQDSDYAFLCAMHLALGGQRKAAGGLLRMLPRMEPHQRAHVASLLDATRYITESRTGQPLLLALLQDESQETRETTVEAILGANNNSGRSVRILLEQAARPETRLRPSEVYTYRLPSEFVSSSKRTMLLDWSKAVLADSNASPGVKTLAILLLGGSGVSEAREIVEDHLHDPNIWQRRAAWRALWHLGRPAFEPLVATLAGDSSPRVREVLPACLMKGSRNEFEVWFGEREFKEETSSYRSNNSIAPLSDDDEAALQKLASDTDPKVRLAAMAALLSWRRDVQPLALREAAAALGMEDRKTALASLFRDEGWRQFGPRYGFLLDYMEPSWFGHEWRQIVSVLRPDTGRSGKLLTSFASLVKDEPLGAKDEKKEPASVETGTPKPSTANAEVKVILFYKVGCKDCARTRDMLHSIGHAVPLTLVESDIESSEGAEWNEVLCKRFDVEGPLHRVSPAVFTHAGFLVRTQITMNALQRLMDKTLATAPKTGWESADEVPHGNTGARVQSESSTLNLGLMIRSGLLEGINPSMLALIVFSLFGLLTNQREPKELLLMGLTFIAAVLLVYFIISLDLGNGLAKSESLTTVRAWLNRLLALAALLLAWLSFRDAIRALRGGPDGIPVQTPSFWKTPTPNIGTMPQHSQGTGLVVAAFVSGTVFALFGMVCIGQGHTSNGMASTVYYLAFTLPLAALFLLVYGGLRNEAFIAWCRRHASLARFVAGAVFLALWVMLMIA